MLNGLVGLTAIDVSLCGATASQSVDTFAAVDVEVEQIGFGGFLNAASPGAPSAPSTRATKLSNARCVVAVGSGLSSARARRLVAAAATARATMPMSATIFSLFTIDPPSLSVVSSAGPPTVDHPHAESNTRHYNAGDGALRRARAAPRCRRRDAAGASRRRRPRDRSAARRDHRAVLRRLELE